MVLTVYTLIDTSYFFIKHASLSTIEPSDLSSILTNCSVQKSVNAHDL